MLTWAIAAISVFAAFMIVSVLAFGWPGNAAVHLSRMMQNPTLLSPDARTVPITVEGAIGALKAENTGLSVEGDVYDRLAALRRVPPIVVDGGGLALEGAGASRTLVASTKKPISSVLPADNAGLGLARAIAVANVLKADGKLKSATILPMSAAQLVLPGDILTTRQAGDVKSRRRIEIRIRSRNAAVTP